MANKTNAETMWVVELRSWVRVNNKWKPRGGWSLGSGWPSTIPYARERAEAEAWRKEKRHGKSLPSNRASGHYMEFRVVREKRNREGNKIDRKGYSALGFYN